jgi:integrase
VDFHALRVTYVSWLVRAGVHPKTAQVLARHASIETTMQAYTDLNLLDCKRAAESLPRLGAATSRHEAKDAHAGDGDARAAVV